MEFQPNISSYYNLSDTDLLNLLSKNDKIAFTELYERFHNILFSYANKKIADKEEARDIVQDILLNLWNKRSNILIKGSLKSYLFTSVRNKILDLITHKQVEEKYLDNLQKFIYSSKPSDYLIREKEIQSIIEKEIMELPPRMQEIFNLSRKEWLSNAEIADKLSLSTFTVETQVKRALRILRKRLNHNSFLLLFFLLLVLVLNFF